MKHFQVQGKSNHQTFIKVVKEKKDELEVLITRKYESFSKETKECISRNLFDMCLRTGYLKEIVSLKATA